MDAAQVFDLLTGAGRGLAKKPPRSRKFLHGRRSAAAKGRQGQAGDDQDGENAHATAARILITLFFCLFRLCLAFRLSVSEILRFRCDRSLATLLL